MAIALFDLDKTLLTRNSAALWLIWELRAGNVRLHQAAVATAWLLRYRLGKKDLVEPLTRSVQSLRGVPAALWQKRTQTFYAHWVRKTYRTGGLAAIRRHRAKGDHVVLLSSTHAPLAACVQKDLHFDDLLCTHLEVDDQGLMTGRVAGGLCFGQGKLTALQELCRRLGATLNDCTFYTDSNSDSPVLEAVARPVAVNPDPALLRRAKRAGWPIVDWGRAATAAEFGRHTASHGANDPNRPLPARQFKV